MQSLQADIPIAGGGIDNPDKTRPVKIVELCHPKKMGSRPAVNGGGPPPPPKFPMVP